MSKGICEGGRCGRLKNLQKHSCAEYLQILKTQPPGTLKAYPRINLPLLFTLIIYYFNIHFNIIFRLPMDPIFLFTVSEVAVKYKSECLRFSYIGLFL